MQKSKLKKTKNTSEFYKGLIAEETGNFDQAITHYQNAIEEEPTLAAAYNNLGYVLYVIHNEAFKAKELFEKAIDADSEYPPAYNNLAYLYECKELKDEEKARLFYQKEESCYLSAIKKDEGNPETFYNLGNLYLEYFEDSDKAYNCFQKVYNINNCYRDILLKIAKIQDERSEKIQANKNYIKAILNTPDDQKNYYEYALFLSNLDDAQEGSNQFILLIKEAEKLSKNLPYFDIAEYIKLFFFDYSNALLFYIKAADKNPKSISAHKAVADILYNELEKKEEAKEYYKFILEIKPKTSEDSFLLAQICRYKLLKLKKTEKYYLKSLSSDHKNDIVYYELTDFYLNTKGNYKKAKKIKQKYAKHCESDVNLYPEIEELFKKYLLKMAIIEKKKEYLTSPSFV